MNKQLTGYRSSFSFESLEARRHLAISSAVDAVSGLPLVKWSDSQTVEAVPGSYIVTTHLSAGRSKADPNLGIADILGTKIYESVPSKISTAMEGFPFPYEFGGYVGAYGSFSINVPTTVAASDVRHALMQQPEVKHVTPNLLSPLASVAPNPNLPSPVLPTTNPNWWVDEINLRSQSTDPTDENYLGGWDYSTGSSSIGIALIDSGLDIYKKTGSTYENDPYTVRQGFASGDEYDVHPELAKNIFVNKYDDNFNGSNDEGNYLDLNGSGGFDPNSPHFEPQFKDDRIGWDFYGDTNSSSPAPDNNPTSKPNKPHGTQVAGILAADGSDGFTGPFDADEGSIAGVTWNSKVMPLKVSWSWSGDTNTAVMLDATINAITYVNMMNDLGYNIRIITGAWGFYGTEDSGDLAELSSALDAAASREILVVVAAQNRSNTPGFNLDSRTGNNALYPMKYTNPTYVPPGESSPRPKANIIVVAATAENDDLAKDSDFIGNDPETGLPFAGNNSNFSTNYGATEVHIAAPGTNILSTNVRPNRDTTDNPYTTVNTFGSSLAMPQVAGVAALALSMKPDLTVAQLQNVLTGSTGGSYHAIDVNADLVGLIKTPGILNARKALSYVKSTYGNYLSVVVGDEGANRANDEFRIFDPIGGAEEVVVQKWNGAGWDPFATCSDDPTKVLAVFGLAGNDKITVLAANGTDYDPVSIRLYINGGTGDDTIFGSDANDTLFGSDGNDSIFGGLGDDTVFGDAGNDIIRGEGGNDYLAGGDGADSILGHTGADAIYGGAGNDTIKGDADADTLRGEDGNDLIYGGTGNDTIFGHGGSDNLWGGNGGGGGSGTDRFYTHGDGLIDYLFGEDAGDNDRSRASLNERDSFDVIDSIEINS